LDGGLDIDMGAVLDNADDWAVLFGTFEVEDENVPAVITEDDELAFVETPACLAAPDCEVETGFVLLSATGAMSSSSADAETPIIFS
jgi:hypothetical protein